MIGWIAFVANVALVLALLFVAGAAAVKEERAVLTFFLVLASTHGFSAFALWSLLP